MLSGMLKVKDLRNNKFYLITDEITGITSKMCAIACNYLNKKTNSLATKLLHLSEFYENKNVNNIPIENLVGSALDGVSNIMGCNIMGCNNSLSSRRRDNDKYHHHQKCTFFIIFHQLGLSSKYINLIISYCKE